MIHRLLTQLMAMLALAGVCLASAGCAAARPSAAPAWPAGPVMIVVAPDRPSPADLESEAYADWSGYLNDFAAEKPPGLAIVRMLPARWRKLAPGAAGKEDYATVFLRRDGSAMLHAGKLLDPQIYPAGAAWARGGAADGLSGMGLRPLSHTGRR